MYDANGNTFKKGKCEKLNAKVLTRIPWTCQLEKIYSRT